MGGQYANLTNSRPRSQRRRPGHLVGVRGHDLTGDTKSGRPRGRGRKAAADWGLVPPLRRPAARTRRHARRRPVLTRRQGSHGLLLPRQRRLVHLLGRPHQRANPAGDGAGAANVYRRLPARRPAPFDGQPRRHPRPLGPRHSRAHAVALHAGGGTVGRGSLAVERQAVAGRAHRRPAGADGRGRPLCQRHRVVGVGLRPQPWGPRRHGQQVGHGVRVFAGRPLPLGRRGRRLRRLGAGHRRHRAPAGANRRRPRRGLRTRRQDRCPRG